MGWVNVQSAQVTPLYVMTTLDAISGHLGTLLYWPKQNRRPLYEIFCQFGWEHLGGFRLAAELDLELRDR